MSSLYELTQDFETVMDMVYDEDADIDMLSNTLDCIECELEEKADGYAKIIRSISGNVSAIADEMARLSKRKNVLESRKKWLESNLEQAMLTTGKKKFKTLLFSFNIQKVGGKQSLDVYGKVPDTYTKTIVEPDNDKIRKALEDGQELDFAVLQERKEKLRIR